MDQLPVRLSSSLVGEKLKAGPGSSFLTAEVK